MIICAGPSLPASQVPSFVTMVPCSMSATSRRSTRPSRRRPARRGRRPPLGCVRRVRRVLRKQRLDRLSTPRDHPGIGQKRDLVRKGRSSTCPTNTTARCLGTGNSGLVTLVGCENVGPQVHALAVGSDRDPRRQRRPLDRRAWPTGPRTGRPWLVPGLGRRSAAHQQDT
jgi:hypothetical protein